MKDMLNADANRFKVSVSFIVRRLLELYLAEDKRLGALHLQVLNQMMVPIEDFDMEEYYEQNRFPNFMLIRDGKEITE